MRLASIHGPDGLDVAIQSHGRTTLLSRVNAALHLNLGPTLGHLVKAQQLPALREALRTHPGPASESILHHPFQAPVPDPPKIWGIGLNYREHAADLDSAPPEEPGSWMRPATTLAAPGATIRLPRDVGRVTGEGEIAVVLGAPLKDARTPEEALAAVAGFTLVLDMTAEDLLRKNLRYLTRAKSYDTFCITGPWLVTPDEWFPEPHVKVKTLHNGKIHRENTVGHMTMQPLDLLAWHSHIFPWQPGDLLLTGTPGAAPLAPGDRVGVSVTGLGTMESPVL